MKCERNINNIKSNRKTSLDILKCVLAIAIVAIHTQLYPHILYPWLRLAVPLFFVISSFLLFEKINEAIDYENKKQILFKYLRRNAILYLFYFIILLPYTFYIRNYFEDGIVLGILRLVKSILFASSFSASWYIQATIAGTCIIFYASQKLSNRSLLLISSVIYLIVCVRSSWLVLFDENIIVSKIYYFYEKFFGNPVFSAPSSFIWITIGKCFAERSFLIKRKYAKIALLLSWVFLYFEWFVVKYYTGEYKNDCYIFLVPSTIVIFSMVSSLKLKFRPMFAILSKISIIMYATHIPISIIVSLCIKRIFLKESDIIVFWVTIIICTVGGLVVLRLEKYKYFRWLKYAH